MSTPEMPIDQKVQERPDAPVFSESLLQQTGVKSIPTVVKQVEDNSGNPSIGKQPVQSGTIVLQPNQTALLQKAKGSVVNAATWLAKFLLRLVAKQKYANTNTNTNE